MVPSRTASRNSHRRKRIRRTAADDYVGVAIAYAEEAIADTKRKRFGKWVRLAAKRFVADLKRAQRRRPPFVFSADRANHACAFIEQLPHVEGSWNETNLIRLEPSQVFFVVNLFGFRQHDGARRFTSALFAVARKNAKSTLAAAILLYSFCCEPEIGPQIISAATTGDQARIVWGIAKRMVEKTGDLREAFGLEAFAHTVVRYEVGGVFKPINAKASTQDGLNPSALSFDELHAHKTHDLYNVLRSAAGARDNPLFLYTTTEGYENPGPWADERKFAEQLLEGVIDADHYLAIIYALDDEDDDFDETKWIKANPLLGVSVKLEKLKDLATEAKAKPGTLGEFRIKRLNRRASAANAVINLVKWRRCAGALPLERLQEARCFAAIDLASTADMNAMALLWLLGEEYFARLRYWVPSDAIKQRTERKSVNYAGWVTAGHVKQTEGDVTDYAVIEQDVMEEFNLWHPEKFAYDPWNAAQFANNLVAQQVPMVQFIQGPKSYQPAWKAFEHAYTSKPSKLTHEGNPVLTWNAANLVPRYDANMNFAPDRKRSTEKIDGMVALLMAFGLSQLEKPEPNPQITLL